MKKISADVVVIGGGPGGYACAFRAADLGLKVVMVEMRQALGGVCLHEGCIPSKALLHVAALLHEVKAYKKLGIADTEIQVDTQKLRAWIEQGVIDKLSEGLDFLSKKRSIEVLEGRASIPNDHTVRVEDYEITARHIVIATGSQAVKPSTFPEDPRIWEAKDALMLEHTQGHLLIIGAGIIGCEMACIYAALGMRVTVCDHAHRALMGMDEDMAQACTQALIQQGITFIFSVTCTHIQPSAESIAITLHGVDQDTTLQADRVLFAVGRKPMHEGLGLEALGIVLQEPTGAIIVNEQFQTNVPHIYALGDVAGGHLAHEATAQGRLCAEVLAGKKRRYDVLAMPSVVYTYPELASVGMTEDGLRNKGQPYQKKTVSWRHNGRALACGMSEGQTKLLSDMDGRFIGGAIFGAGAGDLISELALALEMGCDIEDIALTVHPHPTVSETVAVAAERIIGTATE